MSTHNIPQNVKESSDVQPKNEKNLKAMDGRLESALKFAERGWPVFPVGENKLPTIKRWETAATTDPEQIRAWFEGRFMEGCNFGFCPGRAGIFVIDTDRNKMIGGNRVDGEDSLRDFVMGNAGNLPETFTVRTPSGGLHRYYKAEDLRSKNAFLPAVDVKSCGGYVVIPGSVTDKGSYIVEKDLPVAELPEWFKALYGRRKQAKEKTQLSYKAKITADTPEKVKRAIEIIEGWETISEGARNDNLFQMMREMCKAGITKQRALELYTEYGIEKIGLDPDTAEVEKTINSAYKDMSDFGQDSEEARKLMINFFDDLPDKDESGEAAGATTGGNGSLLDRFRSRLHKGEYYLNLEETDLEYWVDGLLPAENFLVDICGAPGCGKSTFIHQLCVCVLNGVDFLGHATHPVTKSGKVFKPLIISCEEPEKSISRRMKAQTGILCGERGKVPDVLDLLGEDTTFYQSGAKSGSITDQLKAVMAIIKAGGYNFVAIDNRGEVFKADENNREEVSRFCGPLKSACRSLRIQTVVLSHTNRRGTASGSTAWTGSGRVQIRMENNDKNEEIGIRIDKANDVPRGLWETVKFMPKEDGTLGECFPVLIPTIARISEEDLLQMVVEATDANGITRRELNAKLKAEPFFENNRVKEIVDLAIKQGLIVKKTVDGYRKLYPKANE